MEEEARRILCDALSQQQEQMPLGQRLLRRFSGTASTDFALPTRHTPRNPPAWD
jgi:plasmid stability protein